ncbi:hypothetical protein [Cohnella sp.]|uniref:hypothetical protein n=1 Tax=Cohnella sp. TaxID=1883426 RepID=UPI00356A6DFB
MTVPSLKNSIYDLLSARENVTFFSALCGLQGSVLNERVEEALEFTGLQKFAQDMPGTFSGGMKRRLNSLVARYPDGARNSSSSISCRTPSVRINHFTACQGLISPYPNPLRSSERVCWIN